MVILKKMYIKTMLCDDFDIDVIVSDGMSELLCMYCGGSDFSEGTEIEKISAMFSKDIMRIDGQEYLIQKKQGKGEYYAYYLRGKVLDTSKSLIGINGLRIELDKSLPKDIKAGEFIEFKVDRLDCYI